MKFRPSVIQKTIIGILFLAPLTGSVYAGRQLEAVTFAADAAELFIPVGEAMEALKWDIRVDAQGKCTALNGRVFDPGAIRYLMDGTQLISTSGLAAAGAEVTPAPDHNKVSVSDGRRSVMLVAGPKRVEISLRHQLLTAWQGSRVVMQSRISSGRGGSTPSGDFRAGPYKARSHYSSRYHNAPMPWSVQIHGHIFVHGFSSVPNFPASHGCIRLPLTGLNPARFFYDWTDVGTPVRVIKG